jgi:hypothetical protein
VTAFTGGSAASKSHGFSPYRHALELLASATRGRANEPECSVTIQRNFKHDWTFEVVVRGTSPTDCNLLAQYEADLLAVKYPVGGAESPQDAPNGETKPTDERERSDRARARRISRVAS